MLKKTIIYSLLLILMGGVNSMNNIYGQSPQKADNSSQDYFPNTKLKVVTHATGLCVNPADSKAGLQLSAENGIDIDCNLRLSKDGELVLAHDPVSDRNFWGDLNKTRIPYNTSMTSEIGNYDFSQFVDETFVRFEDFLEYMKNEAPTRKLFVEVKAHTKEQQAMAVQKIIKYGLTDRVYLQADFIDDKNLIRNSNGGKDIKIIMWVNKKESLIDEAIADGQITAIVMSNEIPELERVVDKVYNAGLEVVVYGWHWNQKDIRMLDNKGYEISIMTNTPDHLLSLSPFNTILKPVIHYPVNNQTFSSGDEVKIKTYVGDNQDFYGKKRYTITKVEFFANDTLIGSDENSPFDLSGWKPKDGIYSLKAKVFDDGQTTISNPVIIRIGK